MGYEVKETEQHSVVLLTGEIDLSSSPEARKVILGAFAAGRPVLVDLSAVEYIDSSGVASLVEGYQKARTQDQGFALVGVSQAAMNVLQLARLDKVFPIYANLSEYRDAV